MKDKVQVTIVLLAVQILTTFGLNRGFTNHFKTWLVNNGYESYNFDRPDLSDGAFGGMDSDADMVTRQPVIFLTGNTDHGVGVNNETG